MISEVVAIVRLFPLLLPVWQERPVVREDIYPSAYPTVVTEREVATQQEGLLHGDSDLRSTICRELRETGLPSAFDVLVGWLSREGDPRVRATVLQQLDAMGYDRPGLAALVEPYLKSADEDVRYWAVALYGRLEGAKYDMLFEVFGRELTEGVRERTAAHFCERHKRLGNQGLTTLWADRNPRVRAYGFMGGCRQGDVPGLDSAVSEVVKTGHPLIRHELSMGLSGFAVPLRRRLLPVLAGDSHPSVRASTAEAIGAIGDAEHVSSLLALTRDSDAEVRREAVESCARFPREDVVRACVERLSDERTLVRRQAEETLVILDESIGVGDTVSGALVTAPARGRYHICRVLGRRDYRAYSRQIAGTLPSETRAENIASVVFALGELRADFASTSIAALSGHDASVVRQRVARALGRLGVVSTYGAIKRLAFDADEDVRHAAVISMGWLADGKAFGRTLTKVLQTVVEEKMTPANRAAAAWAAGRSRPVDPGLMKRLVVQGTTPVVPGDMGEKLFEEDYVLVSVSFALAECARDDAPTRPLAEAVLKAHSLVLADGALPDKPGMLVPSAETREYARQARAFMEGFDVERVPRPTQRKSFAYGSLADKD